MVHPICFFNELTIFMVFVFHTAFRKPNLRIAFRLVASFTRMTCFLPIGRRAYLLLKNVPKTIHQERRVSFQRALWTQSKCWNLNYWKYTTLCDGNWFLLEVFAKIDDTLIIRALEYTIFWHLYYFYGFYDKNIW